MVIKSKVSCKKVLKDSIILAGLIAQKLLIRNNIALVLELACNLPSHPWYAFKIIPNKYIQAIRAKTNLVLWFYENSVQVKKNLHAKTRALHDSVNSTCIAYLG